MSKKWPSKVSQAVATLLCCGEIIPSSISSPTEAQPPVLQGQPKPWLVQEESQSTAIRPCISALGPRPLVMFWHLEY